MIFLMNWISKFLTSSIGKKFVMGATGLFLISFLIFFPCFHYLSNRLPIFDITTKIELRYIFKYILKDVIIS